MPSLPSICQLTARPPCRCRYQEAFKLFDTEGAGEIEFPAFKKALQVLGQQVSHDEAAEMFAAVDLDGSGEIDFKEFIAMLTGEGTRLKTRMDFVAEITTLREHFAAADVRAAGALGPRELQQHFENTGISRGLKAVEKMISEVGGSPRMST